MESTHKSFFKNAFTKIKAGIQSQEQGAKVWLSPFAHFALILSFIVYSEVLLYGILNNGISGISIWLFILAIPSAAVISALCGFFGKKVNRWIGFGFVLLLDIFYGTQLVYYKVFGSYLSINSIGMGGDAITSFWRETLIYILSNIHWILLLFLPTAIYLLLTGRKINLIKTDSRPVIIQLVCVLLAVSACIICTQSLSFGGTGYFSPYNLYHSSDTDLDNSASRLGILPMSKVELRTMIFGSFQDEDISLVAYSGDDLFEDIEETPVSSADAREIDRSPNEISGLDFAALNEQTQSSHISALNDYFAATESTSKNEYTGHFSGKNLIVLCAESFSPYLIDKERTPALYRMANGGFIFNNFYNSFPNVTTNGEYALCTGLFPDMSREKTDSSFLRSAEHLMPFCLGNEFKNIGVPTYAYHDYVGWYYRREITHPNMGYDTCKFADDGMKFTSVLPASDLEMMQQSVDDYINDDQFHAYYMTVSGHIHYDFNSNPMCKRNHDAVRDLDYPETVKAYISCNLELEYALEYLIDRLESAGKLEDTVIVLTTDHFPYGLYPVEYNALAGKEIDTTFEKFKSSFICWCAGMETPVVVDDYCCTVDILPTLLNLFGLEYDSRMLAGRDVLSDCEHIAMLSNQSFLNERVWFDSRRNEAHWLTDVSGYTDQQLDDYLQSHIALVKSRMSVSIEISNSDYYRFLFNHK